MSKPDPAALDDPVMLEQAAQLAILCDQNLTDAEHDDPSILESYRELCREVPEYASRIVAKSRALHGADAIYAAGVEAMREAAKQAQPCTAENPDESSYELGRFHGIMQYGRAIRALPTPPNPVPALEEQIKALKELVEHWEDRWCDETLALEARVRELEAENAKI